MTIFDAIVTEAAHRRREVQQAAAVSAQLALMPPETGRPRRLQGALARWSAQLAASFPGIRRGLPQSSPAHS